jgi:hypothetical protein
VNLLLAAVHHLLLEGADHELALRYRSVCQRRGLRYVEVSPARVAGAFASFCHAFHDEIVVRCTTRATQTNEVGRSAILRCCLAQLRAEGIGDVHLLDLGCSAGLNLMLDSYHCHYGAGLDAGPPDATVRLDCRLRGAVPPTELPSIGARLGLDLQPVDPTDPDAVSWLLACLWPDDVTRFERLEAAIDVTRARVDEMTLCRGDMVGDLAATAALADDDRHLVILNCWSAAYLEHNRRVALASAVRELGARRPVTWVTMEGSQVVRSLGVLTEATSLTHRDSSVVAMTRVDAHGLHATVVAETHAHGAWLDWRGLSARA